MAAMKSQNLIIEAPSAAAALARLRRALIDLCLLGSSLASCFAVGWMSDMPSTAGAWSCRRLTKTLGSKVAGGSMIRVGDVGSVALCSGEEIINDAGGLLATANQA